jgi:hypothetical protein
LLKDGIGVEAKSLDKPGWIYKCIERLKKSGFKKAILNKKMEDLMFNILYNDSYGNIKPNKTINLKIPKSLELKIMKVIKSLRK